MAETPANGTPPPDTVEVHGQMNLFGYDPAPVRLRLLPRSRRWRLLGAGRTLGITLLVAPVGGMLPPHAPWVVGVLGAGGFLAHRRFHERFTVVGVEGSCPKCSAELTVARGTLRSPHPLPCEACHHEGSVAVEDDALEAVAAGR